MKVEESIYIQAPLPVVWAVFSCFEDWENWNTVCSNCCFLDDSSNRLRGTGNVLTEGVCLSFVIRPIFPVRIRPKVVRCTPGSEIVWEGSRFGIRAEHAFVFHEKDQGVLLVSIETFRGPVAVLCRLFFVLNRLHQLTRQLLSQIKRTAEDRTGQV